MDVKAVSHEIANKLNITIKDAQKIVEKAKLGGEISTTLENWLSERFLPNCVFIDEDGYTKMCINALKILDKTAASDYGSSRQRDFGQLWADMTRGYLGEYAVKLFLKQNWGIDVRLGHEEGDIQEFLPTDIHQIKSDGQPYRPVKLNVSIKTSKWNGIWLDIPGDQFNHSDIHVFVKVGTGRDHLFAFFKHISVFKDKILKRGEAVGSLTPSESLLLFDNLPVFSDIPAYICGFVRKDVDYQPLPYRGKLGKKHYTIHGWNGAINPTDLQTIKQIENVPNDVKFAGIGRFSHNKGYLFNTGNLLWEKADWDEVIAKI